MSSPSDPLPEFRRPPVAEVVLGVEFEPLSQLGVVQLGLLWSEFRDRFPRTETHVPLPSSIEQFGVRQSIKLQIEATDTPPVPRLWLLNDEGTELIQVQQDRFIHNWRKVSGQEVYPRYRQLRETFIAELRQFQRYLQHEHIGEMALVQCELTYVDEFRAGAGWDRHGQLGEILTIWNSQPQGAFLPEPENASINARYIISDATGEPIGRLHLEVEPAYRVDTKAPILVMKLTARGRPDGDGLEGVLRFLDRGHEWTVRGFASLTTETMHRIWERIDDIQPA